MSCRATLGSKRRDGPVGPPVYPPAAGPAAYPPAAPRLPPASPWYVEWAGLWRRALEVLIVLETLLAPRPASLGWAGFWRRLGALFIDLALLSVVALPAGAAFVVAADGLGLGPNVAFAAGLVIGLLADWVYHAAMESSQYQATLGKMALGIIVTDLNGNTITFGRATGRHFGKFVSGLLCGIGYIMAGFTEKKQALHDMMAGCLVMCRPR